MKKLLSIVAVAVAILVASQTALAKGGHGGHGHGGHGHHGGKKGKHKPKKRAHRPAKKAAHRPGKAANHVAHNGGRGGYGVAGGYGYGVGGGYGNPGWNGVSWWNRGLPVNGGYYGPAWNPASWWTTGGSVNVVPTVVGDPRVRIEVYVNPRCTPTTRPAGLHPGRLAGYVCSALVFGRQAPASHLTCRGQSRASWPQAGGQRVRAGE